MESNEKSPEVMPNAEAHLTDPNSSGVDERGAPAPNQHDQVEINNAKKEDPSLADPRWPAGTPMQAIQPTDKQSQEMNKGYEEHKAKAAEESEDRQPVMGTSDKDKS